MKQKRLNKSDEALKEKPGKYRVRISLIVLILLTFGVYSNSLKTPFIFDDIHKIVRNYDIQSLSNLKTKLIYPYNMEGRFFQRNDPSRPDGQPNRSLRSFQRFHHGLPRSRALF